MEFPSSFFVSTIKIGTVLYFSSDQLNTKIPHNFICVYIKTNEFVILSCCTTQKKKREEYLKKVSGDYGTLVYIKPDEKYGLTEDTFINCNQCFIYSHEKLIDMYNNKQIDLKGEITDVSISQIHKGISLSNEVEREIKKYISELL